MRGAISDIRPYLQRFEMAPLSVPDMPLSDTQMPALSDKLDALDSALQRSLSTEDPMYSLGRWIRAQLLPPWLFSHPEAEFELGVLPVDLRGLFEDVVFQVEQETMSGAVGEALTSAWITDDSLRFLSRPETGHRS